MSKLGKRLIKTAKYNRALVKELEEARRLPPVKVFASAQEVLDYFDENVHGPTPGKGKDK